MPRRLLLPAAGLSAIVLAGCLGGGGGASGDGGATQSTTVVAAPPLPNPSADTNPSLPARPVATVPAPSAAPAATPVPAPSLRLSWMPSETSPIASVRVYRAEASGGPYAMLVSLSGSTTFYEDAATRSGATYFYVVTAVDARGVESAWSNEASGPVP